MTKYLLTNISRKPLMVFDQMLASTLTSITNTPGTMVIGEEDLSNYDVVVYLRRGSIKLDELDRKGNVIVKQEIKEVSEDVQPQPEQEVVPEEPPVVLEEVEDDTEPKADMYTQEDLKDLSSSELRSILSSLGGSSNARKKSVLIKKIMEAQNV